MYDEDDEFLRSIPAFLRRFEAPPPRKLPIRPRDLPAARTKSKPAPIPVAGQAVAPATPAAQRTRIELAFKNQDLDQGATGGATGGANGDDVAFQVTLPRGVVRQIRILAAEKDTTQRAVVLRALRLAGLSVPEGSDIDRRGRAAKRQA
jgi:hypothetical protein